MKSIVFGATSGIGWEIALELARNHHELLIVGQNEFDLQAAASHLRTVFNIECRSLKIETKNIESVEFILTQIAESFGKVNYIFYSIGYSSVSDNFENSLESIQNIFRINFFTLVVLLKVFKNSFEDSESIGLISFSSISAIRGRDKNIIYASSKRAIESLIESFQSTCNSSNLRVKCYRLGYVDTSQTYEKTLLIPPTKAKVIARVIIKNLNRKQRTILYLPRYWFWLSFLVKIAPVYLIKKLPN